MKKSFKKLIAMLLIVFLAIPVVNVNAATKLERVKTSLGFADTDDLKGHTEKDLLTKNYDFNKNAKFTSNDKLMYRFTLAYAVRNTASRDKEKLYTNEWFEKHYKEILDKAYAGADTEVDFYKNKDGKLCIKVYMKGIYLDYGFRDSIRTEIIKDMAEVGIVMPTNRVTVTSSQKENATRINPCPGLSDSIYDLFGAADGINISYYYDGTPAKGNPGEDATSVTIYVNSTFQDAIHEYAVAHNMTEFKAVMRMFNAVEFDNLINIWVYFNDGYYLTNEGTFLENKESSFTSKSKYGLTVGKQETSTIIRPDYDNSVNIYSRRAEKTKFYGPNTAYDWIYELKHQ